MSSIQISNLNPAGSELFQDSETFLNELAEHDLETIQGAGIVISGVTSAVTSAISIVSQISISKGISLQSVSIVSIG